MQDAVDRVADGEGPPRKVELKVVVVEDFARRFKLLLIIIYTFELFFYETVHSGAFEVVAEDVFFV